MLKLDIKGKKVTVMRIGLLGRGIGDAAYLAKEGAEVLVVDDAPAAVMQPAVDALVGYKNIRFKFGPYEVEDFTTADYVLVGAGAPVDLPVLEAARSAGVTLKQSAAWFAELAQIPIIGVTGTRGKSTVTHMIHHILSTLTDGGGVLLGGNVRGVSNLQLLDKVQPDSICVMELDSWQLQGFGWAGISPQVSVFTSFMEDHLNYYQTEGKNRAEAMADYFTDKAQIFLHQNESDVLVTTPGVFEWVKQVLPKETLGQELVLVDSSLIPEEANLAMPGEHNRLNAALALSALVSLGMSEEEIFAGLATFPGVPGRLEQLGTIKGVKVYNDNNATTPAAVAAGVRAVASGQNVVLIAGGADKGLDLAPLLEVLEASVKTIILLPGTGTKILLATLAENSTFNRTILERVREAATLAEAVEAGLACGQQGDVLLFSPGFASFGMFKNEYERNDEFVALITAKQKAEEEE